MPQKMKSIMGKKACKECGENFAITNRDFAFYEKMQVPPPKLCRACRYKRHLAQINQINLFKNKCDATGKNIISNYPPDSPYKIFSQKFWFSDAFDGINFGREFNFSESFFEQFHKLSKEVPRPALFTDFLRDENSEYTNYAGKNKNCYLIFDSDENWDCLYSYGMNSSKNSMDCYRVQKLELCYETIDSKNCYNCAFIANCDNCADSMFLNNCQGVRNCIFCSNIRHKEYHILNQPVSKETFEKTKNMLGGYQYLTHKIKEFEKFRLTFPQKFMQGFQNEDSNGNHLVYCKNAVECFDSMNIWDGKYCTQMFMKSKDVMDCDECGEVELLYECNNLGYNGFSLRFCLQCLNEINNLTYCNLCFHCSDLFGCIGLRGKKYCILNKQYSKEEYENLVPKIIQHMGKTEEWGEYFPITTSALPYNITMAQDYFPLSKEEALKKGYAYHDDDPKEYRPQHYEIPDHINNVPDSITNEILACADCGKNYKIVPQELAWYRRAMIPIPKKCFNCRHKERIKKRTERRLYHRQCQQCGIDIQTSYNPEKPERVYCEKCYLESIK